MVIESPQLTANASVDISSILISLVVLTLYGSTLAEDTGHAAAITEVNTRCMYIIQLQGSEWNCVD